MILLKIYVGICILFGLYANMQQYFRYPFNCSYWKQILVFIVNTIGFPICLVIALYKNTLIPWNLINALKEQGPFKRAFKNFIITGNARGMFSINSHWRGDTKKEKVRFNTKYSASKVAESMSKKHNKHFSVYRCIFCGGYHVGKNRDSKEIKLTKDLNFKTIDLMPYPGFEGAYMKIENKKD